MRNAEEARIALENGASLIDVKEPSRGALGRADDAEIEAVLEVVGGRLPVSAALGEMADEAILPACAERLAFVKRGLAGMAGAPWVERMCGHRAVPCAYADWKRANAPRVEKVIDAACRRQGAALLIDTWEKDGTTLLDWISRESLARIAAQCREAGLRLALAGSLSGEALAAACAAGPDWVAVRGAVCEGGRGGTVRAARVRAVSAACRAQDP